MSRPHRTPAGRNWPWASWSLLARTLLVLVGLVVIFDGYQLVSRARQGKSDVSVMIRTATLINEGAGPELYQDRDEVTGWSRAHPPAALVFFQPLVRLGPTGAGVGWALANFGFLFLSLWSFRRFISLLGPARRDYEESLPWLVIILLILSAGSIEVGQFSLLILCCWILALQWLARGRDAPGGMALALPITIKLYPALLLGALGVLKPKRILTALLLLLVGLFGFGVALPTLGMGGRALPLAESWITNTLMGAGGRITTYFEGPGAASTQSLESLLMRFLTGGSTFHARHPHLPHLNLDPTLVLTLVAGITLVILAASAWATYRLRQAPLEAPLRLLFAAALWSATLYAIMPETKARYAVYTFLAFVPLVASTFRARTEGHGPRATRGILIIIVCLLMVMQGFPNAVRDLGVGYIGSLILWGWNLNWSLRGNEGRGSPDRPLPHHAS